MAGPPSSPRLPSPPPAAEIQMSPTSPSGNSAANRQASQIEQAVLEANSKRRIHKGSKAADMAAGPPLMPLNELDSAFQLQEHLAALHYHHTKGRTVPCNALIVGFLFDTPPCSAATCPEMRASEWQFLCAVHEQPKNCCAIDYCCHTLDWAANVVTDQKLFPSRFVSDGGAGGPGGSETTLATRNLTNVFRRLHRIFAHAWFQHRSVFWAVERETGLYVFFKRVCDLYSLIRDENYTLPPEAEGLEPEPKPTLAEPAIIEKKSGAGRGSQASLKPEDVTAGALEHDHGGVGRTNTRRHIRSSPSTGSAVTTVLEAEEEDAAELARKARALHISMPQVPVEEEPEAEEIQVIVEDAAEPEPSPPKAEPQVPKQASSEVMDEGDGKELERKTPAETTGGEEAPSDNPPSEAQADSVAEPPKPIPEEPAPKPAQETPEAAEASEQTGAPPETPSEEQPTPGDEGTKAVEPETKDSDESPAGAETTEAKADEPSVKDESDPLKPADETKAE